MKKGFFLILIGLNTILYSQEFKLSKILQDKLRLENRIQEDSTQINTGNGNHRRTLSLINRELNIKLLNQLDTQISDEEKTNSQNLYQYIASLIKPNLSEEIDKIKKLIEDQKIDFDLGVDNLNGFEWQKPIGLVHLYAKRNITQSITHTRLPWQVEDSYIIELDAKTYLKKLSSLKLIEILDTDLEAFANLKFHRKMSFIHYHPTNESALNSKIQEFLIPFLNSRDFSHISTEEFSVSDHFVFNAKASASIIWQPYFNATAKVSSSFETLRNSNLIFQDNQFTLSSKRSKNVSFSFSLQARLEFFKLLKLTLMDLGFQSKSELAEHVVYKFSKDQLITRIGALSVLGYLNFDTISFAAKKRLLVFQDLHIKESNKTNGYFYNVLGWSGDKSSSHNYFEVTKNNQKHLFVKHTDSKSSYKKTFLGTFTSAIEESVPILKIFKYYKSYSKQDFSLLLDASDSSYYALSIKLENYIRIKDDDDLSKAFDQLKMFTNLSSLLKTVPFSRSVNNYAKIQHQIDINNQEVTSLLIDHSSKIKQKIQQFCADTDKCDDKLTKKYIDLKKKFFENKPITKDISNFYKELFEQSKTVTHFQSFFNESNIQNSGTYSTRIGNKNFSGDLNYPSYNQGPNRLRAYISP